MIAVIPTTTPAAAAASTHNYPTDAITIAADAADAASTAAHMNATIPTTTHAAAASN